MAKKPWIVSVTLVFCSLLFVGLAIVGPLIVRHEMHKEIVKSVKLDKASEWTLWGKVPGDSKDVILHEYHLFHCENPEAVLYEGEVPILTEKNGYKYQELDDYLHRSYSGEDKA